jgi:hypothetical protein
VSLLSYWSTAVQYCEQVNEPQQTGKLEASKHTVLLISTLAKGVTIAALAGCSLQVTCNHIEDEVREGRKVPSYALLATRAIPLPYCG